jgi:tetratricopeptide (TPR) repeat protein
MLAARFEKMEFREAAKKHPVQNPATKPPTNERAEFPFSPCVRGWLLGLLLVTATVLAYQPAWHAGFIWDDDAYVTGNPLLTAPDGLKRIWFSTDSPSQYFPLTYSVFRLEHALWGFNSTGYHWINILLHGVNSLLVWRLLKRLNISGAGLAAAIFALHPVQVESVVWITECKNVLMCSFFLLSLLCWIEFVAAPSCRRWRYYFLTLAFYALALFSKTTACTLPAALLLILWLQRQPIHWTRLAQIVPFLAMGVGMGLLTIWWERFHQGTQGNLFSLGLTERILVASHAVWFYMGKLLWPMNLTFSYPKWTIHPAAPLAYIWLVAGIALGPAIWFGRRHVGRSVEVAALFFVATLSPVLGFIMLYTFRYTYVADHYQYVASISLIALVAAGITIVLRKRPFLKLTVCGALLLTLGVLTWRQCRMYADIETLWRTTIDRNPAGWLAQNNLGDTLFKKGRINEAIIQFQKALELQPNYEESHSGIALALIQKGDMDEAISHFKRAVEIQPGDAKAQYNLGHVLLLVGQLDEAIVHLEKGVTIPNFADAEGNLGYALAQKGQTEAAITHYQAAIRIKPDFAEAYNNLGNVLLQKGQTDAAIIQYQKALVIQPGFMEAQSSITRIAVTLVTSPNPSARNGTEAIKLSQQIDQLSNRTNPVVAAILAAAYAETKQFPEAITNAERAVQLASNQKNSAMIAAFQAQLKLYQAGYSLSASSSKP